MNPRLLIDAIVQQTTVLIAQLSTAAGLRSPLAHVADKVFLSLAQEIERQGVSRKVVADMFGLALRTYQRKVQRLEESESASGRTLWEAILEYVTELGFPLGTDLARHPRLAPLASLQAVLKDEAAVAASVDVPAARFLLAAHRFAPRFTGASGVQPTCFAASRVTSPRR